MKHIAKPYVVDKPGSFSIKKAKTDDSGRISKKNAKKLLKEGIDRLSELQDALYADDKWSVLLIFQAMDAAGKDGTIKHVMSGINPQGCQVFSFKSPSAEELDHDFLWRTTCRLPERGRIGIFNRSYYEEVLIIRVHPEWLGKQKLPEVCRPGNLNELWKQRYESINDLEKHLARNGTLILKFFLNVSPDEQARRFLDRLERPEKNWKFSANDADERKRWADYMNAYEQMIRNTSTENGRWYVVPADQKWYARIVVASAIVEALEKLDLTYPKVNPERQSELTRLRHQFRKELKT
ncbi:MAG TPA: polyphosphate kinase 2 family protein [Kiritimatiellia bacterium]|nr:polyphosphate kinase 2 family protein [Kiritimatiellia bacterium]